MADITGPNSTLPGSVHVMPEGAMCDLHPDRPAVARIQGETDSFGSELFDCCAKCLHAERQALATGGRCDWCGDEAATLRNTRDPDEGLYGPVYRACGRCLARLDEAHG